MNRYLPKADDNSITPAELTLLVWGGNANNLAQQIGVTAARFRRWQRGEEPIPGWAYRLMRFLQGLELPDGFGPWAGARIINGRFCVAGVAPRDGLTLDEAHHLGTYREKLQIYQTLQQQLHQARKERDFYRAQCSREAKFGLMLNRIVGY